MKKFLIVLLLMVSMGAFADGSILLEGVTSTGAGSSAKITGVDKGLYTVQVTVTGSPTAVTVAMEGSLDNSGFEAFATHVFTAAQITAQVAIFSVANKPSDWLRGNLTTLTGGTTPTVTMIVLSE